MYLRFNYEYETKLERKNTPSFQWLLHTQY
nr:MAG TPA: Protein of unknown function (DUF585) [Caudoviricetes sp.]